MNTRRASPSPKVPVPPMPTVTHTASTSSSSVTFSDTGETVQPWRSKSTILLPRAIRDMATSELKILCAKLETSSRWLEKNLAQETLPLFLEKVIQWPEEIQYLPHLKHIQEWMTLCASYDKLLVEASRDHFKSSFFSFALPLFWVQKVKDPRHAFGIALFAYSDGQSQKYIKRIRQEIESNPWLKWLVPKSKSSVWDSTTLDMSNGCWIESYGFGSSFRGRHPKKILIDDPCKEQGSGAMSVEQQIQFFSGTIIPAVKKRGEGQIIVTGNPVDKMDFLSWLEENKAFHFAKYPAIDAQGQPLAPEHYDLAAIEDKRSIIPAHIFAREYMLHRVSAADARFREEWITYYTPDDHLISAVDPTLGTIPMYKVLTIDPALSPGGRGDAAACVVTGTSAKYTDVLDLMLFRGPLDVGIGRMVDMMIKHQPDYIGFEEFAFQAMYRIALEEEICRRGLYFNIQAVGRDSKKKKAARIESLQPILSQRRLRFLKEHRPLVDQFLLWDPVSKTNDDDGIDALSWQVPLWRKPTAERELARSEPTQGTFDWAFDQIRGRKMDASYVTRLFADAGVPLG